MFSCVYDLGMNVGAEIKTLQTRPLCVNPWFKLQQVVLTLAQC